MLGREGEGEKVQGAQQCTEYFLSFGVSQREEAPSTGCVCQCYTLFVFREAVTFDDTGNV